VYKSGVVLRRVLVSRYFVAADDGSCWESDGCLDEFSVDVGRRRFSLSDCLQTIEHGT